MFGQIHRLNEQTLMVEGLEPESILSRPDICNVVVHKTADTVYCIDSGATEFFRRQVLTAINLLQPFSTFVLLNSHAHPDHIPNNDLIHDVNADTKEHYISARALGRFDEDFTKLFLQYNFQINEYYNILDGTNLSMNLLFKPIKILKALTRIDLYQKILKSSLKSFGPFGFSRETMTPLENKPAAVLQIGNVEWSGWDFNGDVYALEARGHTEDEIIFYFPKIKLLMLADESFKLFNCWPESNARRICNVLQKSIKMIENGDVAILIDSHTHRYFTGEKAVIFLKKLVDDYRSFSKRVLKILAQYPHGATIDTLYREVQSFRKTNPAVSEYLDYEFPRMPPYLKTVIAGLLLESGCLAEGVRGKKKFRLGELVAPLSDQDTEI